MGDGHRAEWHARAAIDCYKQLPQQERPASQLGGASIDLVAASLIRADLKGAQEHLHTALALVPTHPAWRSPAG